MTQEYAYLCFDCDRVIQLENMIRKKKGIGYLLKCPCGGTRFSVLSKQQKVGSVE